MNKNVGRNAPRWGLYIDIEGFSARYEKDKIDALRTLMCLSGDLFCIGKYFKEKRLFIHQFGDGFLVLPDLPEASLDRPLSIAIALMQSVLLKGREGGGVCRAGISTGDFSDICGCLPHEILDDESFNYNSVRPGNSLMTFIPVMGSTLINSYKLQSKGPKGPLLFVDAKLGHVMPSECISKLDNTKTFYLVDWLHTRLPLASKLLGCLREQKSQLKITYSLLEKRLSTYVKANDVTNDWAYSAQELISGAYSAR